MSPKDFQANQSPWLAETGRFASGESSPTEFLDRCLARIYQRENGINAFVHLSIDQARADAEASSARWKEGRQLSPIDGMPVGIKDIIETRDMPTGQGSPLFTGYRTGRDAACVKALRDAGAVLVGKTVTTEFAATAPGPTRNPWDIERTPGGSSSGSAAGVGAGFISAGLGTQVVGSILRPAGYCGCYGFKPTVHAINRGGSYDYMSQSATGVLAASLEDAWQVAWEIAMRAGGDPGFPGLEGPSAAPAPVRPAALVLLQTSGWDVATGEARAALQEAADKLKESGTEILTRADDPAIENVEIMLQEAMKLTRQINGFESRWPLNACRDIDASKVSKPMLDRLAEAETYTPQQYRRWLERREAIRQAFNELCTLAAGCITLSSPDCAPRGIASTGDAIFVVPGSLLGVPALSLPMLTAHNLPLGLQLLGYAGRDADMFATAAAIRDVLQEN